MLSLFNTGGHAFVVVFLTRARPPVLDPDWLLRAFRVSEESRQHRAAAPARHARKFRALFCTFECILQSGVLE